MPSANTRAGERKAVYLYDENRRANLLRDPLQREGAGPSRRRVVFWRDALERDVAAGEFPRLGSVLVADGGELVYERYFEGDAETRRDTRSATKTIASMLVPATTTRRLGEPVLSVD